MGDSIVAKERPILFTGAMVNAILEGRKTQTRRVVSAQNSRFGSAPALFWQHADFSRAWIDGRTPFDGTVMQYLHVPCHAAKPGECAVCDEWGWPETSHRLWPLWWPHKAYVGDEDERPPHRLWVRETFQPIFADGVKRENTDWQSGKGYAVRYTATDPRCDWIDGDDNITDRCKPSIFMPRWASRIALEITDVRVQRLQEISEEDAEAEGVYRWSEMGRLDICARPLFASLWDSINAKRGFGWDKNPWVWALTFKVVVVEGER